MNFGNKALEISVVYFVIGALWILLSDRVVSFFVESSVYILHISILKGLIFIGLTASLFYFISDRYIKTITQSQQQLQINYDELTTANEELLATEEELRQQFEELLSNQEMIRTQNVILSTLHETTIGLMDQLDINSLLKQIMLRLTEITGTCHVFICLLDEQKQFIHLKAGFGIFESQVGNMLSNNGHGLMGRVIKKSQTLLVNDYQSWEHRLIFTEVVHSMIEVPLKSKEEVIGILGLAFMENCVSLEESRIELLERFAELASIALENAELHTDIQRKLLERKKSDDQKLALLDAIPDLMLRFNRPGTVLEYRKPAQHEMSFSPDLFLGKNITEVFSEEVAQNYLKYIHQVIDTGTVQLYEYRLKKEWDLSYFEARFVKCGENEAVGIIRDITEKKQMEKQLEFLSLRDTLTGVYNRTYFEGELQKIRNQKGKRVGVVVCDVDGLKLINDTLGHHSGDALLKVVTRILKSCISSRDVVARIGGDEFAMLILEPDHQGMDQLSKLVKSSVKEYNKKNPQLPLSLSIGWSADFEKTGVIDWLLKEADNNMYREKLHQSHSTRSAIVQALMQALEARDFITEGHGERLQELVLGLARLLHLSDTSLADLRLFAKFHDIGKVGIPDNILLKPASLNAEELAMMRRHCDIGFRIAKSAPDLAPIAEWILKHQEWWNGGGYPLQLTGTDIPLECRILAIADAYDAMTNDRPYRKAMPHGEAVSEIQNCAGTQFDPSLTELFIGMFDQEEG